MLKRASKILECIIIIIERIEGRLNTQLRIGQELGDRARSVLIFLRVKRRRTTPSLSWLKGIWEENKDFDEKYVEPISAIRELFPQVDRVEVNG